MTYIVKSASTSIILDIVILDSTKVSTTLLGLAGLVFNSGSLTCYYHRNTASSAVAVSLVTMTAGTYTASGFVEVDGTNMPGCYQLCLPNAALAAGATQVTVMLKGAANMAQLSFTIRLTSADLDNATNLGLVDLDATVSSRSTYAGGAVASVTGNIGGSLTSTERNAIADALLDRNMATGVDSGTNSTSFRTPRQALRVLRNKSSIGASTLTVLKEDDSTTSWTATTVSDASAQPVTSVDPA